MIGECRCIDKYNIEIWFDFKIQPVEMDSLHFFFATFNFIMNMRVICLFDASVLDYSLKYCMNKKYIDYLVNVSTYPPCALLIKHPPKYPPMCASD